MTDQMRDAQTLPLLSPTDLSLDLGRQKRLAKDLRNAVRAGNDAATARLRKHHPRSGELDLAALKLTDAQLTIAREAGVASWPALKRHVERVDAARKAIEARHGAPDTDLPTLHVRCGNDIEATLTRAGFSGDFLMFADPICQGPVTCDSRSLETRADFIASEYPGESYEANLEGLRKAERRIAAAGTYGRIALWFEHDPYDQLLLARLLVMLEETGADRRKVELISVDRYPGISKFIGIGQLSPAALRHMYDLRRPVPVSAYARARQAWAAHCAPTPLALMDLVGRSGPLPFLGDAILRYLAELPSIENGLSFTEQTILEILDGGPRPWGQVFRDFTMERDPLPYHGDLMFLGTLLRLRDAGVPAVSCDRTSIEATNRGKTVFSLTQTGRALLKGRCDWKSCAPRSRDHGGVRCFGEPDWRWHTNLQQPVML